MYFFIIEYLIAFKESEAIDAKCTIFFFSHNYTGVIKTVEIVALALVPWALHQKLK